MILGYLAFPLLNAATTGTPTAGDARGYSSPSVTVTASAAISAGTVIVEESDDPTYAGTWSQIESITLSSVFPSAGGKSVRHYSQSSYGFIRTRIGTTVVGGTISTFLGAV